MIFPILGLSVDTEVFGMRKLGLLDQAFVKTEQGGMPPMYMGSATILDPTSSPYPLDAARLANHLAAVLENIPLMRQKLVQYSKWLHDPDVWTALYSGAPDGEYVFAMPFDVLP